MVLFVAKESSSTTSRPRQIDSEWYPWPDKKVWLRLRKTVPLLILTFQGLYHRYPDAFTPIGILTAPT